MPNASPNMFTSFDEDCEEQIDSAIGMLSDDDRSNIESCLERSEHEHLTLDKSFSTKTSTPNNNRNGIESMQFHTPPVQVSEENRNYDPQCIVLRSGRQVALTRKTTIPINERYTRDIENTINEQGDKSDFDQTNIDDDESFRYEPRSSNQSDSYIFFYLSYTEIVKDEDHVSPNLSAEELEEISKQFVKSLTITLNENGNRSKTKRKLWTSKGNENCDVMVQSPLIEAERIVSLCNTENNEIKLRIPIPTYLIPLKFRKKQPNGVYSPVTGNILNTPNSINRKEQSHITTPSRICGFLESLDAEIVPVPYCDPNALYYRKYFKRKRDDLVNRLIKLYDQKVFEKKLGNVSLSVTWTDSPLKTGGTCIYRKRGTTHMAEVQLSDTIAQPSQLRDTLIKELCRAVAWVLNEDETLEPGWKLWAERANQRLPELPRIEISNEYEYVYECIICNLSSFARSQPKKIENTFCAHCHGPIEIFYNRKDMNGNTSLVQLEKASAYVKFVKNNYKFVKDEYPASTQLECMEILSQSFAEFSIGKRHKNKK